MLAIQHMCTLFLQCIYVEGESIEYVNCYNGKIVWDDYGHHYKMSKNSMMFNHIERNL